MKIHRTTTLAATALLALGLAGCAGSPETTTETVTASPVVAVPGACLDALNEADEVMSKAGDAFTLTGEVLDAASQFDVEGMTAGNEALASMQPGFVAQIDAYKAARDECRTAAGE